MKKLLILLLFPLMMFSQDSTLIGDVDCSGEVNSQDASLILQFVTNVIDELPCEANMTGLTPDQLQEMIDMMEDQLNINYTAGSSGGFDIRFPEGLSGDIIIHDLASDYTVPSGKNLYINHVYLNGVKFRIDGVTHLYGYLNYRNTSTGGNDNNLFNIVATEGQIISSEPANEGSASFNGFLVDKTIVEPISHSLGGNSDGIISNPTYDVPSDKKLVITNYFNTDFTGSLYVDDIAIHHGMINYNAGGSSADLYTNYSIIINGGSTVFFDNAGECSFNGYLVDEDYFSSADSGSNSSGGDGVMSVSTFGDTLTLNGESIIVPGISYSNIVPEFGSVTDIDGNVYETVSYGGVEWMRENLRVTTFNDGNPIPEVCDDCMFSNNYVCDGGWCYYSQQQETENQCGKLYNGYLLQYVNESGNDICPSGWHISTVDDWDLITGLFVLQGGNGTNGVYTESGNIASLLASEANESYLSIELCGANDYAGDGYNLGTVGYYFMAGAVDGGIPYGQINDANNNNEYYSIAISSFASLYTSYCIRCVKD